MLLRFLITKISFEALRNTNIHIYYKGCSFDEIQRFRTNNEGIRSMIIIRGYNFKNTYEGILLYLTRFNISLTFCRQVCSTAQRDPEPCPPAQPCPYTRRSHHIAHVKDRRIGRRQRQTPRGPKGTYGAHEFYTLPNPVANPN